MKNSLITLLLVTSVFSFWSCSKDSTMAEDDAPGASPTPNSTFEAIQYEIFDSQCVDCHTAGTSFAQQSGLILTADSSYDMLVGREPKNTAALNDGLLRVGTEGLASVHRSFLWEKLNANSHQHFYDDHPQYGALMPLGKEFLTNGQLALLEEWIIAGAPRDSHHVDLAVLEDTSRYKMPEFTLLPPPESGMQFHLGPFEIAPNYEREFFYYEPLYNNEDLYVNKVEISMRSGSHHFIVYRYQDNTPSSELPAPYEFRDIRDENGVYIWENLLSQLYHEFFAGTQFPLMSYSFPEGMALKLPANSHFDLNSHYVNRTSEAFDGEVVVNLHTIEPEAVERVAYNLFLSNQNIILPANEVTTLTRTFTFPEKRYIVQLMSHAHEHMVEFKAYVSGGARDGELVYIAYDWEHPPILEIDPPLVIEAGEGLTLEATYDNWTNKTLNFGLLSEDEMMIMFGIYYTD